MILWTEINCIDVYQVICCFPLWEKKNCPEGRQLAACL